MTARRGAHTIAKTSRRPFRLADLVPVRFSPGGRRSFRALRTHGAALHAVSTVLTEDRTLGARLAVFAIAACGTDDVDPGVRDLSAAIVIAWLGTGADRGRPHDGTGPVAGSSLLHDVHGLPDDQRALLALCKFGGHTFREAALVLGIPADQAAVLLGDALRSLAIPHPLADEQPVMA